MLKLSVCHSEKYKSWEIGENNPVFEMPFEMSSEMDRYCVMLDISPSQMMSNNHGVCDCVLDECSDREAGHEVVFV